MSSRIMTAVVRHVLKTRVTATLRKVQQKFNNNGHQFLQDPSVVESRHNCSTLNLMGQMIQFDGAVTQRKKNKRRAKKLGPPPSSREIITRQWWPQAVGCAQRVPVGLPRAPVAVRGRAGGRARLPAAVGQTYPKHVLSLEKHAYVLCCETALW